MNGKSCCDNGAEILRPQHFVAVCELTSIHDDILSKRNDTMKGSGGTISKEKKGRT